MSDLAPTVILDYTNWRGERKSYRVDVLALWFGKTAYHPEPCFLLKAATDRGERDFAMANIHSWVEVR